jgi:sterol desaturase/sphingolipid hydroxylase (fatty acid hydroxylase superfamily)
MKTELTQWTLTQIFMGLSLLNIIRYTIFAGGAFVIFWGLLARRLSHRRIQKRLIKNRQIIRETGYSLISILILAMAGTFIIWYRRSESPVLFGDHTTDSAGISWMTVLALILLHDAYFYFAHRFMHLPGLYRLTHIIHHRSIQPTPMAAFAFQPAEAFLQSFFLIVVFLIHPVSIGSVAIFLFYSLIMNITGHLGYEIFPAGFTRNPWTWWSNTPTHHAMHHRYVNCNYSLYFNWWDRLLGTNHERYHEAFDSVTVGKGLEKES